MVPSNTVQTTISVVVMKYNWTIIRLLLKLSILLLGMMRRKKGEETARVSFIALRVSPNKNNGLISFSTDYLSDDQLKEDEDKSSPNSQSRLQMRYIVVEVRKKDQFITFLDIIKKHTVLGPFMDCAKIESPSETRTYTVALDEAHKREKQGREQSLLGIRTRQGRQRAATLSKKNSFNQLPMLVYPFTAPPETFEAASNMLTIANGQDCSSLSKEVVTDGVAATEDTDKKEE